MKKFLSLLITALIVGFMFFVVWHWVLKIDPERSFNGAIGAGLAGLLVEYLRPYFGRRKRNTKSL